MHLSTALLVVWIGVIYGASGRGPLVGLKQGKYRGNYVRRANRNIQEYLGIPFAKPPVGELRLANPEPVEAQEDEVFDAKEYAPSCPQVRDTAFGNFSGSTMWNPPGPMAEDCLYLNIWVPLRSTRRAMEVMVWIYGGGFAGGSTALPLYDGTTLADEGNIVVVSISYRLGALGFLSLGNPELQGNFGLMDQVMALNWIKNNIKEFQGDPDKITLFGESAGAVSVLYHMLSPLSNGLFQRGVVQSFGGDDLVFQTRERAAHNARKLIERLECDTDDDYLACLRRKHYGLFIREQHGISENFRFGFHPTISPFMPKFPKELLETGEFEAKDLLLGVVENEGTYFMIYHFQSSLKDQVNGKDQNDVRSAIDHFCPDENDEQRQRIFDFYTKGIDADDKTGNRDAIDNLMGDRYFKCSSKLVADSNAKNGGNTFFYRYNHRARYEAWPKWMGVYHGGELPFFFGEPRNYSKSYAPEERRFSDRLISYLTNFAKTGNPNNQGNSPWPRYTESDMEYVELALHEQTHEGGYRSEQCAFWDELLMSGTSSQSATSLLIIAASLLGLLLHLQ